VKKAVYGAGSRPGAPAEAIARGERAALAAYSSWNDSASWRGIFEERLKIES